MIAVNSKTSVRKSTMRNMTTTALMAAMITILTAYIFHIPDYWILKTD